MTIEAQLADGRVLQFPDGTDPAVVQRTVKAVLGQSAAPERSAGVRAARMADQGAQGFIDQAADIVTAPADLIWKGAGALGLPTPGVSAGDTLKGYIHAGTQAANELVAPYLPDMGRNVPETQGERNAHAAGAGAADALSVMLPGAAVARGARAGTALQRAGVALTEAPVAQMASGAVGGGVTEDTGNPLYGLAASLATPGIARAVGGRAMSPVRSQLNPEQQRLAAEAQRLDIPLTAAQRTGSRPLQSLESVFSTLPMTAGAQQRIKGAQQSAFNREALKHIGETGTEATDDVLDAARQRIGGKIESLARQTTVVPDQEFTNDLMDTVSEYSRRLDAQRKPVFENFVSDINDAMMQGGMPGDIYQKARSQLSQMANAAGASDPYFAQALRALRDTLDNAADRAMPANLRDAWRDARREWGHLRTIEKSRSNTTTAAAGGDIPPTAFANAVKQANKRAYAFGAGGMNKLSKIGTTFVRDPIPNSGTPERLYWQNLLTNPFAALGATGAAMAVDPTLGAATVGGTLIGPRIAQKVYNSSPVQTWLSNQRGRQVFPQYTTGLLGAIGAANLRDDEDLGLLGQ
jgi:hypothetical protein